MNIKNNLIKSKFFGFRSCYVNNPYPKYTSPIKNMNPPRIIDAMRKSARNNAPSRHPLWYTNLRYHSVTNKLLSNERSMNLHRSRAIDAVMECIAAHVNIITGKVYMSLKQISDACGLTTYNKLGVPCYSRASRAINEHIEAIGAVLCDRIWDNITKSYIPNIIWVTKLFFVLIGYEYGKFLSAQNQQLAWENQKLKKKGEDPISITEAKRRAKANHIKRAFDIRMKKKIQKKQRKQALKISLMDEKQARHQILKGLIKFYTKDELTELGYVKLNRLVTHRYHLLCKIAGKLKSKIPDTS